MPEIEDENPILELKNNKDIKNIKNMPEEANINE